MEKIDLNIGEKFTNNEGKTYQAISSPATDCNACKGCIFRTKLAKEEDRVTDLWACNAPENLLCCKPDRIFVEIPNAK